jgi:hypothetical protein
MSGAQLTIDDGMVFLSEAEARGNDKIVNPQSCILTILRYTIYDGRS